MIEDIRDLEPMPEHGNDFISCVSARLFLMITQLDNKIESTEYDSVFNRDCDLDDLRCLKRTLEIFNEKLQ